MFYRKIVFLIVSFLLATITILIINNRNSNELTKEVSIGIIDAYIPNDILDIKSYSYINLSGERSFTNMHGMDILHIIYSNCVNSSIYYASVLDQNNIGEIDNIVKAIAWCIENDVDVICMSFTTIKDNVRLSQAVSEAIEKGIIVVSSCLNHSDEPCYPAMYENVVSVSDGANSNAKVVLNFNKLTIKYEDIEKELVGTSYINAYVCSYISNQLSYGNDNITKILKSLNEKVENT